MVLRIVQKVRELPSYALRLLLLFAVIVSQTVGGSSCCCLGRIMVSMIAPAPTASLVNAAPEQATPGQIAPGKAIAGSGKKTTCPACCNRVSAVGKSNKPKQIGTKTQSSNSTHCLQSDGDCNCTKQQLLALEQRPRSDLSTLQTASFLPSKWPVLVSRTPAAVGAIACWQPFYNSHQHSWQAFACLWRK